MRWGRRRKEEATIGLRMGRWKTTCRKTLCGWTELRMLATPRLGEMQSMAQKEKPELRRLATHRLEDEAQV